MGLIGILADAHGHSAAFEQGVIHLREAGANELFFIGDAVGYIPDPSVVKALRKDHPDIRCLRGNHEEMLLSNDVDTDDEPRYLLDATRGVLNTDDLEFIASWPNQAVKTIGLTAIQFFHGSPSDHLFGYVYPDSCLTDFSVDSTMVVMANTHRPFVRWNRGTCFVNVGSCGMPRDDGRYGSVALIDTVTLAVRILRFNISASVTDLLGQYSLTHSSVVEVFQRRSRDLVGELI